MTNERLAEIRKIAGGKYGNPHIQKVYQELLDYIDELRAQLAAVEKGRDKALEDVVDFVKERDNALAKVAASEAREVQLRGALEKVLNWRNPDGLIRNAYLPPWMVEECDEALSSTSPPPLLGVLKEVEAALSSLKAGLTFEGVDATPGTVNCMKALNSLRAALGGREE